MFKMISHLKEGGMTTHYKGKGLVIPSQLSATNQISEWENGRTQDRLQDVNGAYWRILSSLVPNPKVGGLSGETEWNLTVNASTEVKAEDLPGFFDDHAESDLKRLESLIGLSRVPIAMKAHKASYDSQEKAREDYLIYFNMLREKLKMAELKKIKKSLVLSWIEKTRTFGNLGMVEPNLED
jgi:hypothetical protein